VRPREFRWTGWATAKNTPSFAPGTSPSLWCCLHRLQRTKKALSDFVAVCSAWEIWGRSWLSGGPRGAQFGSSCVPHWGCPCHAHSRSLQSALQPSMNSYRAQDESYASLSYIDNANKHWISPIPMHRRPVFCSICSIPGILDSHEARFRTTIISTVYHDRWIITCILNAGTWNTYACCLYLVNQYLSDSSRCCTALMRALGGDWARAWVLINADCNSDEKFRVFSQAEILAVANNFLLRGASHGGS